MTTVVNTPGNSDNGSSGLIIGVIVAIVILVLFFMYGLPALRSGQAPADNGGINVNVDLPSGGDNSGGSGGAGGAAY